MDMYISPIAAHCGGNVALCNVRMNLKRGALRPRAPVGAAALFYTPPVLVHNLCICCVG